jgi:hypothetical protein
VPLIASSHHERYDGNGYPRALKGDGIHLLARILAVADVLDAITSKRHYRTAMSIYDALNIIKRETGGHFDPQCANALFRVDLATFIKIHLADHLSKFDASGLLDLEPYTIEMVYNACQATELNENEMKMMREFYRYYQGPVPAKLVGKIQPAPVLETTE